MSSSEKLSPLAAATRRLSAALDRLEQTLQEKSVKEGHEQRQQQHLKLVIGENDSLKNEQERLNEALDNLQAQYDDLQKVAVGIYGKLDDSVRRISKIIGG